MEGRRVTKVHKVIGERLRLRRTMVGISQKYLANLLGVTFQQIQKYEKGINRIDSARLYRISKILLVSVDYFFDGIEHDEEVRLGGEVFKFEHLNKEVARLVKNFIRITCSKKRKAVVSVVKTMNNEGV
jgi:transcriptional regulator with XRE-family HTH domain